jgi:FG-GAP repeat
MGKNTKVGTGEGEGTMAACRCCAPLAVALVMVMTGLVGVLFGSGAAAAVTVGVRAAQKISDTAGNFGGGLNDTDWFGGSVVALGDLDGDFTGDLAVGARGDNDGGDNRGAVYVLFLSPNGTVKTKQKISSTQGNFQGAPRNGDFFGVAVAALGDLDGDRTQDLAVGAYGDDDGGQNRGAVYVLFLQRNGTVKAEDFRHGRALRGRGC